MTYDPYGQQRPPAVSGPPNPGWPLAQPYAQAGFTMQTPPPKKRRWPWIVGGITLVGILGCVGLFTLVLGGTAKVATELDDNQKGKNAVAGQMNTPITDGKFQFTVTGMKCGLDRVGSEVLNQKAQGEFCLVSVSVKNVADTAEMFVDSSQQATDAKGATYSVDSGAGLSANEESSVFLEQINPGNTVKGKLVFDVPKGTKLTAVILHESMYTPGAKIPLK
ncbi:DUF4352 domain-containing protein [Paractinoplanes durhamensis]|uniref:Mpr protein n=1 Tax=Paractinoplanes durhamensis TaxID=113563 RepID=A0ABQ3ZEA9_9ACTN|nr:DUF4352 domain-containing protein [Actinoplanes durhamensis]GIE08106.1 Mpr protein [Actinoplanes durhamensis]